MISDGLYLIDNVFYYWFVAMIEGVVTVKTRIIIYISYKLNEMIYSPGVYIWF